VVAERSASGRQRIVREEEPERPHVAPYTGPFADVMALLAKGRVDDAVARARGWREEAPGDLLALLALGEALEAKGDVVEAARAYGALIDLFADRADIRRLAGARLDRLASRGRDDVAGVRDAAVLAEDTWRHANVDRPDHPQGARGQAWALWRLQRFDEAFAVVERAILRDLPDGRFAGVPEILRDDLALLGAAWAKTAPTKRAEIAARLQKAGAKREDAPSLRFLLWWETDANDVDFHIHDGRKNHAWYSQRELPTGGVLYADVTTGFGPECFTIPGARRAFPYKLEAHYYSRGPMGFGMGALRVVEHDGNGGIVVEDRPFVIMVDGAYVDLGVVRGPLGATTPGKN
jgi:tetratricopeptide (TPR) repeat protein